MSQGLQRATDAARATRGQRPRPVHLLDPTFPFERTYCGHGGATFSAPTTTDPAEATCKTCVKVRRKLDRERSALAMARDWKA